MTDLQRAKLEVDLGALMRADGIKIKPAGPNEYHGLCPFHDNKRTGAFSVKLYDGRHWAYKCFNPECDAHGTLVDYLVHRDNLDAPAACRKAIELVRGVIFAPRKLAPGVPIGRTKPELKPITPEQRADLERWQKLIADGKGANLLKTRGLTRDDATALGLGLTDAKCRYGPGHLVFPLYSIDGELAGIKCRITGAEDDKYRWITPGRGSPVWLSPNLATVTRVLLGEGELNAMGAWTATKDRPGEPIAVVGMGSAENHINPEHVMGRDVYLWADPDKAGAEALVRWASECAAAGARNIFVLDALPEDAGDYCAILSSHGRDGLWTILDAALGDAEPTTHPEPAPETTNPFGLKQLDTSVRPPPVQWAVDDLIPRGKITLFAAYGGVGKSSLMAFLAVCLAHRMRFFGRWTTTMPVAYLDWEDDEHNAARWVRRVENGLSLPVGSTNLAYTNVPTVPGVGHLPFHQTVDLLIASLTEPSLIIVDTFESSMQIDSNKAVEALVAMSALKRLTNAGHTVLALDHLPKLGKGQSAADLKPMGSVQKTNQARAVFMIEDVTPAGWTTNVLKFSCVKLNGARRPDPFAIERKVDADNEIATFTECDIPEPVEQSIGRPNKTNQAREILLEALQSGSKQQAQLVAECGAAGIGDRTVRSVLADLEKEGVVLKSGGLGKGDIVIYRLKGRDN